MNSKSNSPDTAVRDQPTLPEYRRQQTSNPNLDSRSEKDRLEDTMLALESYDLDESRHNAPSTLDEGSVSVRSLTVLVTSIQWCIAISFLVAIVSAGTWSVQHQWVGYAVFILSVVLCTAINPILQFRMSFNTSLTQRDARRVEVGVAHRLQRQTGFTLLVLMGITTISGWMYTLDFFWGLVWIEDVHSLAAYSTAGMLFLYSAIALYFNQRSNYSE